MAELVTLTEDGPLGKAGEQVWVDDTPEVKPKPAKKAAAAKKQSARKK